MKSPTVRVMAAAEEDSAVEIIVLAFAADPMARWTWPHAHPYLAAMPRLVRAFGRKAFSSGSAFCSDGCAGTALWLPPGVHSDEEELDAVLESTVEPSLAPETATIFERMATYHPAEPHWYLAQIGVSAEARGMGVGSALLESRLKKIDAEGLPTYLESSNERNRSLYRRHGFESIASIDGIPNASPEAMWRPAQR